jgi:hypothetical protein
VFEDNDDDDDGGEDIVVVLLTGFMTMVENDMQTIDMHSQQRPSKTENPINS